MFTKDVVGTCIALWFGWMSFGICELCPSSPIVVDETLTLGRSLILHGQFHPRHPGIPSAPRDLRAARHVGTPRSSRSFVHDLPQPSSRAGTLHPRGVLSVLLHRQRPHGRHVRLSLSSLPLCLSDSFGCCILIRIPWRSPRSQTFWAMVFPAEIIIVFGPDLSFASGALIISNSVPRSMLGIGGGLMNLFVVPPSSLSLTLCVTSRRY